MSESPRRRAWALPALGLALLALTAAAAYWHAPGATDAESAHHRSVFVALACVASLVYLAAVAVTLNLRLPRRALWGILLCAALMRLAALPTVPLLSTDVYRYVWDGKVQVAGINPYRYIPDAPELKALRDDFMFPRINRADYAHTIYPPTAELVYFLGAFLSPTYVGMKALMVALEIGAIAVMLRLLGRARLPRERILIYAWNPLPVWEFAGNGHVDALALALIALMMLAYLARARLATGALLGAAILVKFLPLALFPAFWRRWDWRMPAACVAAILLLYLPYYLGVGTGVFGFLPNYASEEGLTTGAGFYPIFVLERLLPLAPAAIYAIEAAATLLLLWLGWWIAFARDPRLAGAEEIAILGRDVLLLSTALMLALTPHFAWYYAWLAFPACLWPSYSVLYLTGAAFLLNFDPEHRDLLWRGLMFGPFVPFAAMEYIWRRRGAALPLAGILRRI
ncbi:MAG TPA: glycosyltransferase 87 family protein [Alphaproteobacteria bacterium]|nr:glycosyltransferase 87 family protein [Alphaproteobacteria bacterium]